MRKYLIAIIAACGVGFAGQAMALHYGAGAHTYCAKKKYRLAHKKACAHWGAHHHHGIHLEGGH